MLARHAKPIAQLVPLDPSLRPQLGFLQGSVDEEFLEPLPDDEQVVTCGLCVPHRDPFDRLLAAHSPNSKGL